ncbi:MAG: FAD-binding oxidoreductase [Pseudomonadota bacterium]
MTQAKIEPKAQITPLTQRLTDTLDADCMILDESERRFFSQDLFFEGDLPFAVIRPRDAQDVVALVKVCAQNAIGIYPRGGGMSYTDAFQPQGENSVVLDTSGLDWIGEVSASRDYVMAGAGCTWATLDAALAKVGMRARFWGPMSGAIATLGGSLSQGSVTFGSGQTGASANGVKSFEIVSGAGEVLQTGSDGSHSTQPFNRHFGPDLTGIFANDAGALGIKTAVTLEIEPRPEKVTGLSFAFDDFAAMAALFGEVSRRRLASEYTAMDADFARQNAGPPDLVNDLKSLWKVGVSAGNPFAALGRMARVALGGRGFMDKAHYTAHFVIEGRDAKDIASKVKSLRSLAKGGHEIVNTVPLMMRADPFPRLPVTHPDGRRMVPVHGIFSPDGMDGFHNEYLALKKRYASQMADCGMTIAEFFAGIAGAGFLYEPVFYWPDTRYEYHARMTPDYLSGLPEYPENLSGRELAKTMIADIIALMRKHGATHFQIGRMYPYAETKKEPVLSFVRSLKRELDPKGILNPGALGL